MIDRVTGNREESITSGERSTELVITDDEDSVRWTRSHPIPKREGVRRDSSPVVLVETYLSPRAPWTEGVSAAGEEALAVAEQHLHVITTILDALALILTGVNLVLRRGPRGVLQVRQRRKSQAVQIIPEKTHFFIYTQFPRDALQVSS